ncbi:MAG: hypothetical protein Q7U98_17240 [Methylicorpusculum sp.]|uniref:hypothetical protein n=1 Tax=Methylicorpusculum sp. TaxID=2713644 RepID=UPI0027283E69|nr:hypothetical protein [Methylicorpusculum sp.]MDO8940902.1 hypothetical protein [Methylicorpusculum sp.]MDP2202407.1 hypothetical protein [Methylicorpusculum sp.]
MAKYLDVITDAALLADPSFTVSEAHLAAADIFVDLSLHERGFNPEDVTLPNAVLSEIAANWAKRLSATEGAITENSPLLAKAREFEKNAQALIKKLTREALGITVPAGTAFGQITLGRG